jgi:hypothetical protein
MRKWLIQRWPRSSGSDPNARRNSVKTLCPTILAYEQRPGRCAQSRHAAVRLLIHSKIRRTETYETILRVGWVNRTEGDKDSVGLDVPICVTA